MQKKSKIIRVLIFIGILSAYMGCRIYTKSETQTIAVRAITEDAVNSKHAIQDVIHLETVSMLQKLGYQNNLIPGFTYRVTIQYDIVSKKGSGFFTKKGSTTKNNLAYMGCSELETSQIFTANKKYLAIDLALTINPDKIVDKNGKTFNPKTMKLSPIISLEEINKKDIE